MEERLRQVLGAHGLSCGAVIARTGEVIARSGDYEAFAGEGLVSSLLGPHGSAKATFEMVQSPERIKPVMGAQGEEFAVMDRVKDVVVVVFGRDRRDVLARYEQSRLVGQSIAATFADL